MFTIIILSVFLFFLLAAVISVSFIARAQYLRANQYEKMMDDYDAVLDEFSKDVVATYQHIKRIDDKQQFEKDDEVGSIFQDMVQIIEKFNEKTQEQLKR